LPLETPRFARRGSQDPPANELDDLHVKRPAKSTPRPRSTTGLDELYSMMEMQEIMDAANMPELSRSADNLSQIYEPHSKRHTQAQLPRSHHDMAPELFQNSDPLLAKHKRSPPSTLNRSEPKVIGRKHRHQSKQRNIAQPQDYVEMAALHQHSIKDPQSHNRPSASTQSKHQQHSSVEHHDVSRSRQHQKQQKKSRPRSKSSDMIHDLASQFVDSPMPLRPAPPAPPAPLDMNDYMPRDKPRVNSQAKSNNPYHFMGQSNPSPRDETVSNNRYKEREVKRSLSTHPARGLSDHSENRKQSQQSKPVEKSKKQAPQNFDASKLDPNNSSNSKEYASNPSLNSLPMSSINSKNRASNENNGKTSTMKGSAHSPANSDASNDSADAETVHTIDPDEDEDETFDNTVNDMKAYLTEKSHTAEQLDGLVEMMQMEFQKLRRAKMNAEMKASTLETDLVSLQQEQDAEYVSLSEEVQKWKRMAQEEKMRYESAQAKVAVLEEDNLKMKMEWNKHHNMNGKSDAGRRVEYLENENRRLTRLLLMKNSNVDRRGSDLGDRDEGSYVIHKNNCQETESLTASSASSKMCGSNRRYGTPEPPYHRSSPSVLNTPASASASRQSRQATSQRQHPHTIHIRQSLGQSYHDYDGNLNSPSNDNHVLRAPSSWHGGKQKMSIRRMPIEIAPPLVECDGIEPDIIAPPARIRTANSTGMRFNFQRKASTYSVGTSSTLTSTARSSLLSDTIFSSMLLKENVDETKNVDRAPQKMLDGMEVLINDLIMEKRNMDANLDDCRSGPF